MFTMNSSAIRARVQEIVPEYSHLADERAGNIGVRQESGVTTVLPTIFRPTNALAEFPRRSIPRFSS